MIVGRRCEMTAAILAEVSRLIAKGYRIVGIGPHGVSAINESGRGAVERGLPVDASPLEVTPPRSSEPRRSEPGSFLRNGAAE